MGPWKYAAFVPLAIAAGYLLAGLGLKTVSATPPKTMPIKLTMPTPQPSAPVPKEQDYWIIPGGTTLADRAVMLDWYAMNDSCQGGDVTIYSRSCKAREKDSDALSRHGWCWSYNDINIAPADYKWHRCSEEEQAQTSTDDTHEASMPATPASDDQEDEFGRPKPGSPRFQQMLALYEKTIEPEVRATALYEANQQCMGLPGYDGERNLLDQMGAVNGRYFPDEPGLWEAAEGWARKLIDKSVAEDKREVCFTLDRSRRSRD